MKEVKKFKMVDSIVILTFLIRQTALIPWTLSFVALKNAAATDGPLNLMSDPRNGH